MNFVTDRSVGMLAEDLSFESLQKNCYLRLRNPGFRNRKPRVFINRQPPFPPPKTPLLVWECMGLHRTMERSAEASFGGRDGGVLGEGPVAIYENPGFPNPGFRNL